MALAVARLMPRYVRVGRAELTEREIQVLELVAQGFTNARIARVLGLHEETVKRYLRDIRFVLKANDRAHAVNEGWRLGYLGGRSKASRATEVARSRERAG